MVERIDVERQKKVLKSQGLYDNKYDSEKLADKIDKVLPMVNLILRNFEAIEADIKEVEDGGDLFRDNMPKSNSIKDGSSVEKCTILHLESVRIKNAIRESIDALPAEIYDVFLHYFWHKLSQVQTADVMELPIRTVKKMIEEVKNNIVTELENKEVTFYNLYWFCEKYSGLDKVRKVS